MKGKRRRGANIDRGLEVISNGIRAGRIPQPVPPSAQAAACGVTTEAMCSIYRKAIRKVKNAWKYYDKNLGKELELESQTFRNHTSR